MVVSTTTRGSRVNSWEGEWRGTEGELRVEAEEVERCDGSSLMVDSEISDMIG